MQGVYIPLDVIASKIARRLHENQRDKGGNDYFKGHLSSVASMVEGPLKKAVAYLHDCVEEYDIRPIDLENVLRQQGATKTEAPEVVEHVLAISRKKDEGYSEYVRRLSKSPIAIDVKIADLIDNMDLKRLGRSITLEDVDRQVKYSTTLKTLIKKKKELQEEGKWR